MRPRPVPTRSLRLSAKDARALARKFGRKVETVEAWRKTGVPKSLRKKVELELDRLKKAARSPVKASKPKKAPRGHRDAKPKKQPPKREKPTRKGPKSSRPMRGRHTIIPVKRPRKSQPPPTPERDDIVPLTPREKAERMWQREILRTMGDYVKRRTLMGQVRANIPGLEYTTALVREDWYLLKDLMKNEDHRWLKFKQMCDEFGFTTTEAKNYWFSPKAIKMQHGMRMR